MTDSSNGTLEIPLFPLRTVLFPEGPLPLRVFEPRYLDMVSRCLKSESGFGVVLIRQGAETGEAQFEDIGTLARIEDWYQGSDGILGITATGSERFDVVASERQSDGLNIAKVRLRPAPARQPLPAEHSVLAEIVTGVIDDLGKLYAERERRLDDASWVAWRLAEILPVSPEDRQRCLSADDALEQLEIVRQLIQVRDSADKTSS